MSDQPALAFVGGSSGPILKWHDRVGRKNLFFKMPYFRTMLTDTPAVAVHLLCEIWF